MHTTTDRLNGQLLPKKPDRRTAKKATSVNGRGRWPKADRVLYWSAAMAPWWLAILLLAVSMPHLASGFQTITGCGPVAGWLLAVAIDSAQIVYATTTASKWTSAGVVAGTSLLSIALNVLAFRSGATDATGAALAWVAGIMLPLMVLALSYTGSAFALAEPRRPAKGNPKGRK